MDVEPDDVEPNQPDNDATNGSPWTLDEPFPSSWVVFWPHQEAPTREEIGSAFAAWLGRDIDAQSPENEEDSVLWVMAFTLDGVDAPAVVWAESAIPVQDEEGLQAIRDCKWVVRMQVVLPQSEPHEAYFRAVSLLAGALGDVAGILDAVTGQFMPRETLETGFLLPEAKPHERWLWRVGGVGVAGEEANEERPTLLFTTGLWRCGRPELELMEIPAKHVRAGLILIDAMAGLLLEGDMPEVGEKVEVGPGLEVCLQPWQEVAATAHDGAPGSNSFRAAARSEEGFSPLLGVRAVVCHPDPIGEFKKVWTWPAQVIAELETGHAALFATEHAIDATASRARRHFDVFATAFASLRRSGDAAHQALVEKSFQVQAPLEGGVDPDRVEQAWFIVQKFVGDSLDTVLLDQPHSRPDLEQGSSVRVPVANITDWRVELPEGDLSSEVWTELLPAVDRLRGIS